MKVEQMWDCSLHLLDLFQEDKPPQRSIFPRYAGS